MKLSKMALCSEDKNMRKLLNQAAISRRHKNCSKKIGLLCVICGVIVLMPLYYHITFSINILSSSPTAAYSKKYIMLQSFGRSGSSFTAALIAHHPEVFYTFEPLYFMVRLHNGTEKKKFENTDEKKSQEVIDSFYNCQLVKEVVGIFNHKHREIDSSNILETCLKFKRNGISHLACYFDYVESCKKHRISFVKTIRFRVKWTEWFLRKYPDFKLIMLIRDPRATLLSQSKVFKNFDWKTEVSNFSQHHCELLADDIQAGERLIQKYPDRVLGIRYEDGALDPKKYAKRIYNFLGLEYDVNINDYVNLLHDNERDESLKAYSIQRGNPNMVMNKWRYGADLESITKIEESCGHLFHKLGYKLVLSQEDLDSNRSLVVDPAPEGIFV